MIKLPAKAVRSKIWRYAAVGGAVALCAVSALAGVPAYQTWRDNAELRGGHITYTQYPCTTMNPAGGCPAYRVDLYGDGTVIYQGLSDTKVHGGYRYHVQGQPVRDFMRDFAVSSFWVKPVATGPSRYGGACTIEMKVDKQVLRNGCWKWQPGSDQAMDDASVAESVAQLEVLSRVNSLARGDAETAELLREAHPYRAQKISVVK